MMRCEAAPSQCMLRMAAAGSIHMASMSPDVMASRTMRLTIGWPPWAADGLGSAPIRGDRGMFGHALDRAPAVFVCESMQCPIELFVRSLERGGGDRGSSGGRRREVVRPPNDATLGRILLEGGKRRGRGRPGSRGTVEFQQSSGATDLHLGAEGHAAAVTQVQGAIQLSQGFVRLPRVELTARERTLELDFEPRIGFLPQRTKTRREGLGR